MTSPDWIKQPVKNIDEKYLFEAQAHQNALTKPQGSLGRLEDIAVTFCGWQARTNPQINNILVRVFAADHGVCQRGVSAFPQVVTTQMIQNFVSGGAAISVLSKRLDADFAVVNLGTAHPLISDAGVIQHVIGAGTRDFSQVAAMSSAQCEEALNVGRLTVEADRVDLFLAGEMGIGNTSSASAIYAALLGLDAFEVVGPGTGVDGEGLRKKRAVVEEGLTLHKKEIGDPIAMLRCMGGFEIAAMTGAFLRCAQLGIPILVDGFICTAAALVAHAIAPEVTKWMLFSHCSAEPAHVLALEKLGAKPLLSLGMRLGEGSGAAVAVPLLQSALALHNGMATFHSAGVSDGG